MTRLSAFARFWYDFIVGDDGAWPSGSARGSR